MEDNYFDKKLKGILESGPDIPMDPAAEQDMLRRLREEHKPHRKSLLLPLLLACCLLIPLLWGGKSMYDHYLQLQQQVELLNQKVDQLIQATPTDTILQKQIIYQFDTIYKVSYITKYITEQSTESNNFYYPTTQDLQSSWFQTAGQRTPFRNHPLANFNRSSGFFNPYLLTSEPSSGFYRQPLFTPENIEEYSLENRWKEVDLLAPRPVSLLPFPDRATFDLLFRFDAYDFNQKDEKMNLRYYFVPTGFSAAINTSPYVLPINNFGGKGTSYGITGAVHLPGNRDLEFGAELLNYAFKLEENDDFGNLPITNPNDPTDVLHELKVSLNYIQLPISIRQKFRLNKKLQPSFKLGVVAYRPLKQQFKYEFYDATGEYELTSTFNPGRFSIDNIRLGVGVQYSILKKLAIGTEFNYQHSFSLQPEEYFELRYWLANLKLSYQLF